MRKTDLHHRSRLFKGVSNTQPGMTPMAKWKTSRRGIAGSQAPQEAAEQPEKNALSPETKRNLGFKLRQRKTERPAALLGTRGRRGQVWFSSTAVATGCRLLLGTLRSRQKPRPRSQCGDNTSRSAAVCKTLRPAAQPLAAATFTSKVSQIASRLYAIIIKMITKTRWSYRCRDIYIYNI